MKEGELTVYNVGQGLCTLYTGILDDGHSYCGIFDCGTIAANPEYPTETIVDTIVEKISKLKDKRIDLIVISHQDIDHWSMLVDILRQYFKMKRVFGIRNLFRCDKNSNSIQVIIQKKDSPDLCMRKICTLESGNLGCEYELKYTINMDHMISDFNFDIKFKDTYTIYCFAVHVEERKNYPVFHLTFADLEGYHDSNTSSYIYSYEESVFCADDFRKVFVDKAGKTALIKNLLLYLQNEGIDDKLLRAHITDLCYYIGENIMKYEDLKNKLASADLKQDLTDVVPIEQVIWGGRKAGIGCRMMREMMDVMTGHGLLDHYELWENGILINVSEGKITLCEEMSYDCYDMILKDFKGHDITVQEIERNVSSAVVHLEIMESVRSLLPGDLTVQAFSRLAEVIDKMGEFQKTLMVAPHHGSANTNFCGYDDKQLEPLLILLNKFSGENCFAIFVSAYFAKFGHPGDSFVDKTLNRCTQSEEHYYCTGRDGIWYECWTDKAFYCTEMLGTASISFPGFSVESNREERPQAGLRRRTPSKHCFL